VNLDQFQNVSLNEATESFSSFDFTFKEYTIETKISSSFTIYLPEQIGDYLNENERNYSDFKLITDAEKFATFCDQIKKHKFIKFH